MFYQRCPICRSPSVASTNLDDFFMPPARRRYVQAPEIFSSFSSKTVDEGASGTEITNCIKAISTNYLEKEYGILPYTFCISFEAWWFPGEARPKSFNFVSLRFVLFIFPSLSSGYEKITIDKEYCRDLGRKCIIIFVESRHRSTIICKNSCFGR